MTPAPEASLSEATAPELAKTVGAAGDVAPGLIGAGPGGPELSPQIAGSKAAMLSRMAGLGLRVPPAFVLPTTLCLPINRGEADALAALERAVRQGVTHLEAITGRRLGDPRAPLLVSVRSGAAHSMPGMLSTVLNVGLNADTVRGLIRQTGNPRLAWDSYRRFAQGYAEVVGDAPAAPFEAALAGAVRGEGVRGEADLDPEALERLTREMLALAEAAMGRRLPADPVEQLLAAARAVYRSWDSPKARTYRELKHLEDLAGTAVTVQAMVFGNAGGDSGAGVAFTRNPSSGEPALYVDYLSDAQGEDVVSGRRTPGDAAALERRMPFVFRELVDGARTLERAMADVQDIEFTVEAGRLFFLQTRAAKRSPRAVLTTVIDLVREGIIDRAEGLRRLAGLDLAAAGTRHFASEPPDAAAAGTPASSGVASGRVAFDGAAAARLSQRGPVILLRRDIATEDVAALALSAGVLTSLGGRTAHAAVVARQLGKVCVVGCADLVIDGAAPARLGRTVVTEGDWLSLDGETGRVFLGRLAIVDTPPADSIAEIESWRAAAAGPAFQG